MRERLRDPVTWMFIAAAVVLAAGIGLRDPWPPDEPRFALIATDMVRSGNWLIPRIGGVLYPDKPPLFFWAVASVYALTGSLRVAFLMPTFLAGLAVLWLVHDLARRLWDRQTALWAGGALLVTLQFPMQMKAGQIDGFLCLWTTLGLYGFCRHLLLGPDWRWYGFGGFACGLGVITKGVGFLPFLLFLPWLVAARSRWELPPVRGGLQWLLAPAAFFGAIALWLVPVLLATSGSEPALLQYRDDILFRQTITRYADSWGHLKPPWYLFTNAIPWLWLPLTVLLPWLVPAWARALKKRSAPVLLLGGWIILVLLFFSLSDGKRSVYIFPALPALALLAAPYLRTIVAGTGARRTLFALAILSGLVPISAGIATLAEPSDLRAFLAEPSQATALSWSAIGIGSAAIGLVAPFGIRRSAPAFAAIMAFFWIAVPLLVYPPLDSTRSGQAIVDAAAASSRPGQTFGFAGWKAQLLLQWNRPAVHFGYRREDAAGESRDAARWVSSDDHHRLVLRGDLAGACFDRAMLEELGLAHRNQWFLATARAVLPSCRSSPGETVPTMVSYDPLPGYGTAGEFRSARRPRATARSEARPTRPPAAPDCRPGRASPSIPCSTDSRGW